MLNITQLLQDSIYFDNKIIDQRDLLMGPNAHLQEIVVNCDRSLAACYEPKIDYRMQKNGVQKLEHEELLRRFVITLHWFLLFSARKQWTHLVVMSEQDYQRLLKSQRASQLAKADQQYLTIKYFLMASYYTHRQADFRHAWHLLLKYGLVDLELTPTEIMQKHEELIKTNLSK
ncbi:dUTPase [Limosilactobacillus coleohominis]|uniref:dUTPase n=1 Tax=Limosilactobacillus coleohominis TaxID=181675 RepID=A0ABS2GX26_9LACO|nr:dUTPase [Limosilactobacillus coleohominis]MBM6940845.1 dUTPase [Limosilactobacillus coleohominis]MBM6955313.1 dUTPase [Limosilactobacillus coleohominis]HJA22977.1 dUTPase [Candidatus Limosilactobacillus intestinavium]